MVHSLVANYLIALADNNRLHNLPLKLASLKLSFLSVRNNPLPQVVEPSLLWKLGPNAIGTLGLAEHLTGTLL